MSKTNKQSPAYVHPLDEIALKNINVLAAAQYTDKEDSDKEDSDKGGWMVDSLVLQRFEDPSMDSGITSVELEYPLFLTFQRLLDFLRNQNRIMLDDYSKRDILKLMEDALRTCYEIIEKFSQESSSDELVRLVLILKEMDDQHSVWYEWYQTDQVCHRVSRWLNDTFDNWVMSFAECRKYLYLPDLTRDHPYLTESDDSSGDSSDDSSDDEMSDCKKEC